MKDHFVTRSDLSFFLRKSNKYIEKSGDTEGRNEVERTTFFSLFEQKKLVMQDKGDATYVATTTRQSLVYHGFFVNTFVFILL
ncbi:hypothetical protein BtBc_30680 (plasmid) [Bacillus thuringiensis]|nr:hypothetical protein YBT1520_33576 [Bacillus thuringiensis serovar kurstaki str. YBT-1520]AIE36888.1 hypothetical protein BTK_34231 [Bacillus thuringiensis serovar kurstaki str. HD-1]AJK38387.1 hypothetical protein BG08_6712 [Bacillus thuringiensis serovar kurstaki]AKJ63216.1 hypothetical protein XI92_34355 [Bacillus thuringiensis]OPA34723.1 hypothetical protein BHL12_19455 [Bacillus cereus]OTZ22537.1 hypothetical protein BK760_33750 [Bacillus thuringiensis serovar tolworthi]OTZ93877.1 hyp